MASALLSVADHGDGQASLGETSMMDARKMLAI